MLSSSHNSLAISSDRIVTSEGVIAGVVLIRDGVIDDLVLRSAVPSEFTQLEYKENVVMPGLVDTHVHINEPGRSTWEGFETATKAAAAGGVTTLVDMPLNSSPVTTTRGALHEKVSAARGKLYVDCGFYGGLVPDNSETLKDFLDSGVLGIKAFLIDSGIDEFPEVRKAHLQTAMPMIAMSGLPLLVHAELRSGRPAASTPDRRSYADYLASRPRSWEHEAIALMISLCRQHKCRTHIVHLSSADAVPALHAAILEGLPISAETCPQFLFFAAEDIPDGATQYKCAPPIREKANRERLWQALREGVIQSVVSDHSPCPPQMKCLETGDFTKAWGGIASLQLGFAVIWSEARRRGHTLADVAEWMCQRPALLVGLEGRKGTIAPGHDADVVVFDPDAKQTVIKGTLHQRHKTTPYDGTTLTGNVVATYLRGRKVFENGSFFGPFGNVLLRNQRPGMNVWNT